MTLEKAIQIVGDIGAISTLYLDELRDSVNNVKPNEDRNKSILTLLQPLYSAMQLLIADARLRYNQNVMHYETMDGLWIFQDTLKTIWLREGWYERAWISLSMLMLLKDIYETYANYTKLYMKRYEVKEPYEKLDYGSRDRMVVYFKTDAARYRAFGYIKEKLRKVKSPYASVVYLQPTKKPKFGHNLFALLITLPIANQVQQLFDLTSIPLSNHLIFYKHDPGYQQKHTRIQVAINDLMSDAVQPDDQTQSLHSSSEVLSQDA